MNQTNDTDPADKFRNALDEEKKKSKKAVILVCGYTGAGKTSLIQAVCGPDVVSEDKITHGKPGTMDYLKYESDLITFWDSQGLELGEAEDAFLQKTREFVRDRQEDPNPDNHIHLVWYAIQGSGARVSNCDLELINNIFPNVIAVITKSDITRPEQLEAITEFLSGNGVDRDRIIPVSDRDNEAHEKLVKLTLELLPEAYKDAFLSAQLVNIDRKQKKAQTIIHSAAVASAAIGAIPIPGSDAPLLTATQIGMIAKLSFLYGLRKEIAIASLGTLLTTSVGMATATGLIKFIPGFGSVIQAGVAAAITEGFGQMVNAYLVSCANARANNEPMPEFNLDGEKLKELINTAKRN